MKLYVFRADGSHFGGAVGILANSPEEACAIGNEVRERNMVWNEKPNYSYRFDNFNRAEFVVERPKKTDRPHFFVLAKVFKVEQLMSGVVFSHWHEG